jgi:transposase
MLFILGTSGMIDVRFCDEVAFNLEPNVPYGWNPIGEQLEVVSRKGGNLNVFGMLNVQTGALNSFTTTGKVDSAQVIEWLDNFVSTMSKTTVLIMDNSPWHKSQMMMAKMEEWQQKDLYIFFIPPYSPHLNLIEILWKMMKYQWLRPQDFKSRTTLHSRIHHLLHNYGEAGFTVNYDLSKICD